MPIGSLPKTDFLSNISARNIAALVAAAALLVAVGATIMVQSAHADSTHVDVDVTVKQKCYQKAEIGIQECSAVAIG